VPITKAELASKIRSSVPAFAGRSDDDLVSEYVKSYPDQAAGITDWRPSGQAMVGGLPDIGGQANISSTPAGRVWHSLAERPVWEGSQSQAAAKQIASAMEAKGMNVPTPFGVSIPASMGLGFAEANMTPLGLATLPLMAGRAAVQGVASLGKYAPAALKALRGLDIGTNVAYGGQGIANVGNAVSDTNKPVMERLGQAGAGLAQAGMSVAGLHTPIVNKADLATGATLSSAAAREMPTPPPVRPVPQPLDPTLQAILAQMPPTPPRSQQLALPPAQPQRLLSGRPEDVFYGGPGGVSQGPAGLSEAAGPGFVAGPQGTVAPVQGNLQGAMRQAVGQSPEGAWMMPPPKTSRLDPTLEAQLGQPAPARAPQPPPQPALPARPPQRLLEAARGLPEAATVAPPSAVKATYIGDMGDDANPIRLYNITEGGNAAHPVNSTVSEKTLIEMGGTPAPAGAVPTIKPQPEAGFISPRLVNAIAGGAVGAATGAAFGETPEEKLAAAAMLGTIGAAGGASLMRRQRPGVNVPSLRNLAKAQANVAPRVPNPLPRTAGERLGDQISEVITDTYQPMNTGQKVVLRNIGKRLGQKVSLSAEDDAYLEIYRQMGGGELREADVLFPFEDMVHQVEAAGASDRFADYMNLQGISHAAETTFPEHVQTLLSQHRKALLEEANARLAGRLGKAADYQEQAAAFRKQADDLVEALDAGELLPEGWNPQTLAADRAAAMAQFSPEELTQFKQWETAVRNLNQRSLELLGEVIKPETLARLQARTADDPRYNPLLRILDHEDAIRWAMNNRSKNTDVVSLDNVMNYLEGSSRPTVHPLAASLRRFRAVVDRVERNRSSKAVFKLRETFDDAPEWDMLVRPVSKQSPLERGWAPMHFYDQGKRITYQVPTHIALSLKGMTDGDIQRVGWLYKLLRGSAKLSRFSAIMGNPAFIMANTIRDPGDAMLMARGVHFTSPADQAKFAVELGKAWKDVLAKDPSYVADLLKIGGGNSGMTTALFPKAMGGSVLDQGMIGQGLRGMGNVSNASEMAPKLALARILKAKVDPKTGKRLWSDAAIASEVRNMGSPDFWRKGSIMASLGDWVFLLNGSIQGIARQSKYFHRPEKFAEALLGAAGIATATAKIASSVKDSDGRPSIQRLSTDDLLNYIVIPTPWDLTKQPDPRTGKKEPGFLKIPMPFGLKPFLIPLQMGLYNAMGLRKEDPEQILLSTISTQLPGQFNLQADNKLGSFFKGAVASSTPIIRAGVEQLANQDMGFDIPIEPKGMQRAYPNPVDRWDAGTSPLARLISQGLVAGPKALGVEWEGVSPKRIEHLMKKTGTRSGVLEPVAKGLDTVIANAAGMPTKPTPKWGEDPVGAARANPILGMFARRVVGTGVDQTKRNAIDQLYDLYGKVADTNAELISKAKERPEELATLWRKPETAQRLAIFKVMQKIIPEFTKIHTQRTYILNHPAVPNREQILKSLDETEARMLDALAPQLEIWTEQLKNPGKMKPQP